MRVTKEQKEKITIEIHKIDVMEKSELISYAQKLYMAKDDLEEAVFYWVRSAVDTQMAYLMERITNSALIVVEEFRPDELGLNG